MTSFVKKVLSFFTVLLLCGAAASAIDAHPLGNFTINHFVRIVPDGSQVRVHYVIDMAEIPAFQAMQGMTKKNDGTVSAAALNMFLDEWAPRYAAGLLVSADGRSIPLTIERKTISSPPSSGGLPTIRIECDFVGSAPESNAFQSQRIHFEDTNYRERIGWHEIVVAPVSNTNVFNSTAFGSGVTDELRSYPQDMLTTPLDERLADFSLTSGALPPGATSLLSRNGRPATVQRDRLAELINVPILTPLMALLGLLIAAGLGALHALSPGHGKTVVGAYLVGSKGTAKHAVFLGLTVTITHTAGVFALGMVTLFASQYIVPERIFPILSFVSGAIVLVIGSTLFMRRLRSALGGRSTSHVHAGGHSHADGSHSHDEPGDETLVHSHGGVAHSHLPPGADGSAVTWRSLLALGISGGLLPCPSALVVLLSAIALHRVGYGLLLVVAFSAGLATTLTVVGLLFVFASHFCKRPAKPNRVWGLLPALSALVIGCVGAAICYEALGQAGLHFSSILETGNSGAGVQPLTSFGALAVLGFGLIFGLKHATEVDHVVAVSTIVTEHRNLFRAAIVGGLWGLGHSASLVLVGVIVLALRVAIPELVSNWLEFGVALMIIGLGTSALVRALRRRSDIHVHHHNHGGMTHDHLHFHDGKNEHVKEVGTDHSHSITRVGIKPLLVGAMHGLAGSGALTVLVLAQISSPALGLIYLAVFGLGSIAGMLMMSFLVGLPFALSSHRLGGLNYGLQTIAGVLSVGFGFWYAYETGIASGLLRTTF